MSIIKQISIKDNSSPGGYDTRKIGAEALNIEVQYDASGNIVTDSSTQTPDPSKSQNLPDVLVDLADTKVGTGLKKDSDNKVIPDFGTSAGKVVEGNDARLSDDRKNPNALNFADGTSYDGSAAKTLDAAKAGAAPIKHASTTDEYGLGTQTNFGHVKVSDVYNTDLGTASTGLTASQHALYEVYQAIKGGGSDAKDITYKDSNVESALDNSETHIGTTVVSDSGVHDIRYNTEDELLQVNIDGEWVGCGGIVLNDVKGTSISTSGTNVTVCWSDPENVTLDGTPLAKWSGTVVVRKEGSEPIDKSDGVKIIDSKVKNKYAIKGFVDEGLEYGKIYYYRFFPYTTGKVYTDGSSISIAPTRANLTGLPSQRNVLVYNGTQWAPTFYNYNVNQLTISGQTRGVNAGTYTAIFTPKEDFTWSDGSQDSVSVKWVIGKANGSIILSADTVTMDPDNLTATVSVLKATGAVSINTDDTDIVTAELIGNTIKIESQKNGEATIAVNVGENANYKATSKNITVSAEPFKIVSWSSGTAKEVGAMIKAYYNNKISLSDIQKVWKVGDSRKVTLPSIADTGVGESHRSQTVDLVIIDFNHDTLTTAIGGKTKALITTQLKDCLMDASTEANKTTAGSGNREHGYLNSTNTNEGGWTNCARRTWCNGVYYQAIQSAIPQMLIKQITHETTQGNKSTALRSDNDYCFLLSENEIFGAKTYSAAIEGTQYEYYKTAANRNKYPFWVSSASSDAWWERSPVGSGALAFCSVGSSGQADDGNAHMLWGLAPACCF